MSNPSVLIIGSGPSAAYAFRACRDNGIIPVVISPTAADRTRGAFWLTWLPESVSEKVKVWNILIRGVGTAEGYMRKQWNGEYDKEYCSFPTRVKSVEVFDPIEGINALWGPAAIQHCDWLSDEAVWLVASKFDLVIQTFPTQESKKAQWSPRKVWVASQQRKPLPNHQGVCIYSGLDEDKWVRYTYAFGELNVEFTRESDAEANKLLNALDELPPVSIHWYPNLTPDTQVLDEPPAKNVLLTGRFARWDRKELSHHSYRRVSDRLKEMIDVK